MFPSQVGSLTMRRLRGAFAPRLGSHLDSDYDSSTTTCLPRRPDVGAARAGREAEMSGGKSFWTGMPGILTGVATLLTAAVAVYPLVNSSDRDNRASSTATPSPTATDASTTLPSTEPSSSYDPSPSPSAFLSASPPRILVTPKKLDFGKLGVGAGSQALEFTVANAGGGELTIEDLTVAGPNKDAFALSAGTCRGASVLGPADDCDATITFNPGTVGTLVGDVVIQHSASTSPEHVTLLGTGSVL